LVARLGVAMAKGIQSQKVVSSPKHFVGYGDCKASRQWDARTDPHITASEMYYIHEYPFRKVFQEAGALGVMCAYNDYDGVPMSANYDYLTTKLRGEMNFKGYVVSDSYAIGRLSDVHKVAANHKESCLLALEAGLNVRTNFNKPDEYINDIRALVNEGRLPIERVNELVGHVLYTKFWMGLFDQPYSGDAKLAQKEVSSDEHQIIALNVSRACLALLKNENNTLPLQNNYKKIAVIGPNANTCNYIPTHYGPMDYKYISVFEGLKNVYKNDDVEINYAKGIDLINKGWPLNELIADTLTSKEESEIQEAVDLANRSDIAVLVVGDGISTSGESRTRSSLDLPGHQKQLVQAVIKTGKPVVIVLIWGRPASINYADRYAKAILSAPYPGAQGGQAIAEALKGLYNPGGKLNGTWPRSVGQIPFNIPTKPNANYEQLKRHTVANAGLLYCFGHGLSYTTFKYDDIKIDSIKTTTGDVNIACRITNTGAVDGDEVVQLYLNDVVSSTTTYEKNLRGFERIHLKSGESKVVSFKVIPDDLILINKKKERVVEPGEFRVMIGSSYDDIRLQDSFYVFVSNQNNKQNEVQKPIHDQKIMNDTDSK
jgi:beta-glucosidase